jgi:hypothetical protein
MIFRRLFATACIAIVTVLAVIAPAPAQPPQEITAAEVDKSIEAAVKFLLASQLPDGGWAEFPGYPHGVSSLVTLALLNSGVEPGAPALARALRHLAEQELTQVYTVSLQTMAFCAANPNQFARQLERNAKWLAAAQLPNGSWSYDMQRGGGDPSNSQFALLALHEAQRAGVNLADDVWLKVFSRAREYWSKQQNADGSFSYLGQETGRGSMTCAGVASLVIVGAQLDQLEASVDGEMIRCCGSAQERESRIRRGMEWMARNFNVTGNPGYGTTYHLYYIYALERAGRMTGQRFIGDHDWYRIGSREIVRVLQDKVKGSILSGSRSFQGNEYSETAFGLLFLAKGKRQIVVSRLKYGPLEDWNHHASAIQNLTAHTEQAWKRDLSWQTIDLSRASVADLLESPVLFISGTRAPNFSPAEKQRLKEYVEQGGFIFAEGTQGNGCEGREFEQYFSRLVVELFEQPLEKLPPDHPIWFAETRLSPTDLPANSWLYGVQTCCRLGVVYCPITLSCRWELNLPYGIDLKFPRVVKDELDNVTRLGVNVLAYATGKELKQKLDAVTILEEVKQQTRTDRGLFVLPVLRHNAGFDDAPRAVPNLVEWMHKENPFQMSSEKRVINITPSELQKYAVVFMHGRGELQLNNSQREALRNYFQNGGFLLADSICADEQFTESFRREMELILGDRLEQLPENHPLLTNRFYGFDIRQVQIINPDRSGDRIISMQRSSKPLLEVGRAEGRIAVVFSPLDLSCALESRHSLQCRGYVRQDAARIGINALLFALQN